jgi:hypothetical protein
MGLGEVVAFIVLVTAVTGTIKEVAAKRNKKADKALLEEMRGLREEVARVRQQHADTVLSFDTTVHRLEQRVQHLELMNRPGPIHTPAETYLHQIR